MSKFIQSLRYAWAGIIDFFSHHRHAQYHLAVAIIVVILGAFFGISRLEWAVCLLCIMVIWSLEAMNSAIEYLTDLVSPIHHPLAGKVKDMAAGAVLLAAIVTVIIGIIIFGPYLVTYLQTH